MSTTTTIEGLRERILARRARITIIGAGYVGLPLAVRCANVGYDVTVYDIDRRKIDGILAGKSHIDDIRDDQLHGNGYQLLCATSDPVVALADPDIVIICVQTPLNKTKDPDVSMVVGAAKMVCEHMPTGGERLVILESTVYPGFTREIMVPILLSVPGGRLGRLFAAFSGNGWIRGTNDLESRTLRKL